MIHGSGKGQEAKEIIVGSFLILWILKVQQKKVKKKKIKKRNGFSTVGDAMYLFLSLGPGDVKY